VRSDLIEAYSSKTDDELLALAAERKSLLPEAQDALWAELRRRRLTDLSLRPHHTSEEIPFLAQNPAFNLPAKIAACLTLLAIVAAILSFVVYVHVREIFVLILVYVLIWGSVFGAIAWATRRALRNHLRHTPTHQKQHP